MSYLGEYQLGDLVPLSVWTDSSGAATEPTDVPIATVFAGSTLVVSQKLPVREPLEITGRFSFLLSLGPAFSVGYHAVKYDWDFSGTQESKLDTFEIVAGGDGAGAGIAVEFFREASTDWVLQQTDQGFLRKNKNPSL